MTKPKVIAFYLPQYHPTLDNDKWWGKGFTEWTNVGKAKPLFRGHYQPKVPADLGYYDLRLPEVREAQAELAKEADIHGFCYYHYWFGNGKEELELPFNEVLRLGKPEFPFMLCWANESWHKKFWDKDGKGSSKEMLIKQAYPGEEDHIAHFYRLLPAFKDHRYITEDGKPLFMIYNPLEFPEIKNFINLWLKLAIENNLPGITFIANLRKDFSETIYHSLISNGFKYVNTVRLDDVWNIKKNIFSRIINKLYRIAFNKPLKTINYNKICNKLIIPEDNQSFILPTLIPNWDHTPRSGINGTIYTHTSPEAFGKHIKAKKECLKNKSFIFLKSWNEWGEGNYIEPDIKFGKGFIKILSQQIKEL